MFRFVKLIAKVACESNMMIPIYKLCITLNNYFYSVIEKHKFFYNLESGVHVLTLTVQFWSHLIIT